MQGLDAGAIGDVEHEAPHRGLRAVMESDDMMVTCRAAEEAGIVSRLDRREVPHRFIEARGFLDIAGDEFDAAQTAHKA